MKYFIISLLALVSIFLFAPIVSAQQGGSFLCQLNQNNTACVFLGGANCNTGYIVGNGCANLSLDPSSSNYCESRSAFCDPDPAFGGNGETCRQNGICDTGFSCQTGNTCRPTVQPPPPASGGESINFTGTCTDSQGNTGIDSAIGCIPFSDPDDQTGSTSLNLLAGFFLNWAIGIGGGIAILLIIYASIVIITSSGDPRRLQGGKDLLTSAIAGVMLIIFSVFILRILGVNVLGIF